MDQDTRPARFVRVASAEPVGADSILTVEDPDDPGWGGATFGVPGRPEVGSGGYLRWIEGRTRYPRKPAGWSFRPAGDTLETGRSGAGMPGHDGS